MNRHNEQHKRDQLWSAYLDGELSPSEALEHEATQSSGSSRQMPDERQFESALGERLTQGPACPDALWNDVSDQLEGKVRAPVQPRLRELVLKVAAAGLLMALAAPLIVRHFSTSERLDVEQLLSVKTVSAMESLVEVAGDESQITKLFADASVPMRLLPVTAFPESGDHATRLLGARRIAVGGEDVVEVMWECCDEPVLMKIMQADGVVASMILDAADEARITGLHRVGQHLVVLIGAHATPGFMDFLQSTVPGTG